MTIDQEDLQPRPADDYLSEYPPTKHYPVADDFPRAYSIILGRKSEPFCHQFGIPFSTLPHTALP